jgi:4-amino-4-deoxy-L-arabinose transferase-like glycosyltransferase
MISPRRELGVALALVALLLATGFLRPIFPVDETRYVGVAWEMWQRGDFLVPYQNGVPYSHKPPLYFWLIHLGWAAFGVNEWWPRVIPALFAVASVFLVRRLARLLWPKEGTAASLAPLILAAIVLWDYFVPAVMFDMMLASFVLLGYVGVAKAWRERTWIGWALFAIGLGGGLFSKGPVALLHLLPLALFAPLWARDDKPRWAWWYGGTLAGVLGGAAIILAWAVPAALLGGEAYRNAIFVGQTTGRVASSFAHKKPIWYYLPFLPVALAPWFIWPRVWRGARIAGVSDSGSRFALVGMLSALIGFSLISGKQIQYLLPEFALFAVLAAHWLAAPGNDGKRWDIAVPGVVLLVAGIAAAVTATRLADRLAHSSGALLVAAGIVVAIIGIALLALRLRETHGEAAKLAVGSAVAMAVLIAGGTLAIRPAYELHPIADRLKVLELQGVPTANEDKYHGQYDFLGRLARPLAVVPEPEVATWLGKNPDGKIVVYYRKEPYDGPGKVELSQPYRGGYAAIVGSGR